MPTAEGPINQILQSLQERAKELNCLYRIDEILSEHGAPTEEIYRQLIDALPPGWQYPDVCEGSMTIDGTTYSRPGFVPTQWCQRADITVEGDVVGQIAVHYTRRKPEADEGPFLKEERRLIDAIAERIGFFITQHRLRGAHDILRRAVEEHVTHHKHSWGVLLDFLERTDPNLLDRITRKMINNLCWNGIQEAQPLLKQCLEQGRLLEEEIPDENRPLQRRRLRAASELTNVTFELASGHLSETEIVGCIQSWINEEKSTFLIKSLENPGTGLAEVSAAVERYQGAGIDDSELPHAVQTSLKVALLRRYFVDSLDYINVAKNFVEVKDFYDLTQTVIHPTRSEGKLGGKGAGLFLATHVLRESAEHAELLRDLRVPRTWYVASDSLLEFIHHNNLEELYNTKYMPIDRVRQDYPHVVQVFKNSRFPPEITKGLAAALDDFADRPIIVRSSSLLEDRVGATFSGKYKSLFLANQGSKGARLEALQDAIAEVYASVFGPDPIEYRAERGLLDFREEMAILIQQVVGTRVGRYFLPAFSGVAFSNNEFRWSPRIRREDGLVRMVPGLGTRAVDRMSDDYPVLLAPGQPGLRANATADEIIRYSPRRLDVINIEKNAFETIDVDGLLREHGADYPGVRKIISVIEHDRIRPPLPLEPDWERDDLVISFDGLFREGVVVRQLRAMMTVLREKLGTPVDLEFASDGQHLYLVQCRAQSHSKEHMPAAIPQDIPRERLVFSANKYVPNGQVPDITHIVYVDPERYGQLGELEDLKDVGRAVGCLNQLLPKRQFILMGPGRWGSRGDIKLGIAVTYSDINNTAVLLEIARKEGNYVPELSFGTHFFQDLVEAGIRYLPLYPDDVGIVFNQRLLRASGNILPELVPRYAHLADTVRVIDVPKETDGLVLRVLMNADLEAAVGLLGESSPDAESAARSVQPVALIPEQHWRWRMRMVERLAMHVDGRRFGIEAMYVFGSTKNGTASPASDIDLIIHDRGDLRQRRVLMTWLEGWSLTLAEVNYLRTGYRSDGLLDVHFVTDEDIANQTSYAAKIDAITDAARPLAMEPAEP